MKRPEKYDVALRIGMVLLAGLVLPAAAWAMARTIENSERIVELDSNQKNITRLLLEVREDVKTLLRRMK